MKKIFITAIALLMLVGCASTKDTYTKYEGRSSEVGFDTLIHFVAYTKTESEFNKHFDMVKKDYIRYNQLFDKYHDYAGVNNIKTINDKAGIEPVTVDPLIIEMLKRSKEYTEISDGYFDITYGAVLEIWHDYREEGELLNQNDEPGRVPSMEMLEEAQQFTGWDFVEIDEVNNTVYLTDSRVKLDVGAIAKGYATELVALALEAAGLEYGVISGGGNVRTINTKPDDVPWAIGVEQPSTLIKNESLDIFAIPHSISIVTSGNYQRYYIGPDEVIYSHLINPKTLMPTSDFDSVTILTPDSTMADALSTAVYMMSYEEALEFIDVFNAKYPDKKIDVMWIKAKEEPDWYRKNDFSFMFTDNLKQYSKFLKDNPQ